MSFMVEAMLMSLLGKYSGIDSPFGVEALAVFL